MATAPRLPELQPEASETASIGVLLRRLVDDVQHLLRTELRLARSEVRVNIQSAVGGLAMVAAGGTLLLVALFTLTGALVGWLEPRMGAGWAAFTVGVGVLVVGAVLIKIGANRLGKTDLTPDRAIASLHASADRLKGNRHGD